MSVATATATARTDDALGTCKITQRLYFGILPRDLSTVEDWITQNMPASEFSHFVDMCEKVRQTASKNAKVAAIAEYLIKLKDQDGGSDTSLAAAVLFMSGAIFHKGSGLTLNVGFNTIMRSLSEIARLEPEEIQKIYLKHGDMGALAEYVVSKRQQSPLVAQQLLLPDLHDQLRKIADAAGSGAAEAKRKILTGLLINSSPL